MTAGATYVVSYYAPTGHYAGGRRLLRHGRAHPPGRSRALADGVVGGNGVYVYGAHAFPVNSFGSTNYWVDAVLTTVAPPDTVAPAVTTRTPLAGSSSIPTAVAPTATFTEAVQPASISFTLVDTNNSPVAGTVSLRRGHPHGHVHADTPLAGGTNYTATVSGASDLVGNVQTTPSTWSFTTAAPTPPPGVCPCSLWNDSTTPTVVTNNDARAVELGVRFSSDADGTITGIRFYKGPNNTGVHTGTLWTSTGTALATGDVLVGVHHRLADRDVLDAGVDHRRHRLRRVVPHQRRLLLVHQWRVHQPQEGGQLAAACPVQPGGCPQRLPSSTATGASPRTATAPATGRRRVRARG